MFGLFVLSESVCVLLIFAALPEIKKMMIVIVRCDDARKNSLAKCHGMMCET